MTNPFSWEYLTAPVSETAVWGPFSIAYVLFFAVGLFLAMFFNYDAPKRLENNQLLLRTIQRAVMIAIPVFSLGLLFFIFRVLQISALGLGMRIWLYIFLLIAVLMLGYFWYYIRKVYPRLVAAEEAEKQRLEYLRRPAHGGGAGTRNPGSGRRSKSKGKKKKKKG